MSSTSTYDFEEITQTEIVACMMWDRDFLRRTDGLIKPDYFASEVEAGFVQMVLSYHAKYRDAPDATAWRELIKEGFKVKPQIWRDDLKADVVAKLGETSRMVIRSRAFLLDRIEEFAQQQEIVNSLIESAAALSKTADPKRFAKVRERMQQAFSLRLVEDDKDYDFFERVEERTKERLDIIAGGRSKTGVTTGIPELDELLKHGGYGRKELTLWMGGAKSTKSFNLLGAATAGVRDGKRVLFITLENSIEVQADRLDADFSDTRMSEFLKMPHSVAGAVAGMAGRPGIGRLKMREYPIGTFRPIDLERVVEEYKVKGITFDLVVIDYLDIMAPDYRFESKREGSEHICMRVRGIAQAEGFALVSAIQTNREGHKAATAHAEHAAEDFNKIRIADLVISVNRTDEEKAASKARLFLAAGRNQRDGITIFVKQDLDRGRAVSEVESVE